ncbi:hypothetical protein Hamer_G006380 [Homarus americanus]|uniref:Uncharacterized protein n=1 Tax=Homarus americanus TaxID=6706 RepID=A0A8J5JIG1_HOMAM|nr:hypothetical protein Hamer_G006380 [Homarus americanus]
MGVPIGDCSKPDEISGYAKEIRDSKQSGETHVPSYTNLCEQKTTLMQIDFAKVSELMNGADDILNWGKDIEVMRFWKKHCKAEGEQPDHLQHKSVFYIDEIEFQRGIKPTMKVVLKRTDIRWGLVYEGIPDRNAPNIITTTRNLHMRHTWNGQDQAPLPEVQEHSTLGVMRDATNSCGKEHHRKLPSRYRRKPQTGLREPPHNTHRNRENNQAANTPRTGVDESRLDGNSEEEPLAARRPRRTIVKPKKYQDGAEDFGTDGSESSGTDEVDDSEMDGETSDEYKPGRSWN